MSYGPALDPDPVVDLGDPGRRPGGRHSLIVRSPGADCAGKDHQPAGGRLDPQHVRQRPGLAPGTRRHGVRCGMRIGSLGPADSIVDTGRAGHVRGARLGRLALVVPLRRAGRGDEAFPGLCIDGHRDRDVQHQRFQHVAAQVLVGPPACVRELHSQFIGDLGNAVDACRGAAGRPLQLEAGHGPRSVIVPPAADTSIASLSTCGSQDSPAATRRRRSSSLIVAPFHLWRWYPVITGFSQGKTAWPARRAPHP